MPKVETKEPRASKLTKSRFKLAEYEHNNWVATVESGASLEEVLKPEYWAHIAREMRPFDHVEARAEDGAWWAHLLVTSCDTMWAKCHVLLHVELEDSMMEGSEPDDGLKVEWGNLHTKYRIIRKSDRAVLQDGFATRDDALRARPNYASKAA